MQQSFPARVLGSKYSTTITFAVVILLFFLPFSQIKCNDTPIVKFSGKNMVLGDEPSVSEEMKSLKEKYGAGANETKTKGETQGKSFIAAIIAFALAIIGLIISLLKYSSQGKINAGVGLAGALSLLALIYEARNWLTREMNMSQSVGPGSDLSNMMKLNISFTFWFYLCLIGFLVAAFFGYHQHRESISSVPSDDLGDPYKNPDIPPNAPQVPIKNPGDQSHFPAAPSGDKDLG